MTIYTIPKGDPKNGECEHCKTPRSKWTDESTEFILEGCAKCNTVERFCEECGEPSHPSEFNSDLNGEGDMCMDCQGHANEVIEKARLKERDKKMSEDTSQDYVEDD